MKAPFEVWDGVFESFAAAPAEGPGFDGPVWAERSAAAARDAVSALAAGQPLEFSLRQRNAVLAPVVAVLLAQRPGLRLLDFGGGPGLGHAALCAAVPGAASQVDHVVVERPAVCRVAASLGEKRCVSFRHDIPEAEAFDIVHAASVLQYIDDWQDTIRRLAACRPTFLSFADIFAGDFRPYVTLQHYYGSRIPHWMLNLDAFVAAVSRHGYRLVLRIPCHVRILGVEGVLPMDNFPPALRIAHTQQLLFARDALR
jgi:putative methyltransferase (TIGR04325 family)